MQAASQDPKPGAEDRAVVLFYDAFGWNTPNSKVRRTSSKPLLRAAADADSPPQLISDVLADRLGVAVYCPDVLCGDTSFAYPAAS